MPRPAVCARYLGRRAAARELRLHAHLAARRAESKCEPVERSVALDLGALGREDPGGVGEVLAADEAKRRALADADLGDAVEERVRLGVAGEVLLPDLGLGALLEDDQRAPAHRRAGGALDRGEADRHLEALAGGDVDERAADPRGFVACDEDVVGGDDRAEVLRERDRDSGPRRRPAASRSALTACRCRWARAARSRGSASRPGAGRRSRRERGGWARRSRPRRRRRRAASS